MALTHLFQLLVLVCCLLASVASSARQLSSSGHTLGARLDDNRGLGECWDALNELKSCTDEIVVFFVHGQTDIDSECCRAIEVITRNCWSAMLTSLGFTSEEGYILRGYCDASPAVAAPAPAPAPVAAAAAAPPAPVAAAAAAPPAPAPAPVAAAAPPGSGPAAAAPLAASPISPVPAV
ncbi:hypothetical protein V6N13_133215 [Hibiscus sabdariffa]|uniref:Prolamin-like domain-containing protein n=2 Tax=Hibiscus sabdariffa TaxID=183260 RepID=A0ABR1ZFI1_9ROSI